MENYWQIESKPDFLTSVTLDFLEEQAKLLSGLTNNNVIAVFCQKRIRNSAQQTIQATLEQSARMVIGITSKDASALYLGGRYEFYITDKYKEYELAMFEIECNQVYPIKLIVDEGIVEDSSLFSNEISVRSHDEFVEYYKSIVQSRKVKYIIRRLSEIVESRLINNDKSDDSNGNDAN